MRKILIIDPSPNIAEFIIENSQSNNVEIHSMPSSVFNVLDIVDMKFNLVIVSASVNQACLEDMLEIKRNLNPFELAIMSIFPPLPKEYYLTRGADAYLDKNNYFKEIFDYIVSKADFKVV